MYNIVKSVIEFHNGNVSRVTVLVQSEDGSLSGYYATNKIAYGYIYLNPCEKVSYELLQKVAGYGLKEPNYKTVFNLK